MTQNQVIGLILIQVAVSGIFLSLMWVAMRMVDRGIGYIGLLIALVTDRISTWTMHRVADFLSSILRP